MFFSAVTGSMLPLHLHRPFFSVKKMFDLSFLKPVWSVWNRPPLFPPTDLPTSFPRESFKFMFPWRILKADNPKPHPLASYQLVSYQDISYK